MYFNSSLRSFKKVSLFFKSFDFPRKPQEILQQSKEVSSEKFKDIVVVGQGTLRGRSRKSISRTRMSLIDREGPRYFCSRTRKAFN